jgi:hypothetical protein
VQKIISIFQWGYEGWGNSIKQLVRSMDAVEEDRGFEAPIFVDVRFSRSVRAIGFRDHAFEELLGHARYRWMRSLGNAAIASGSGKIKIHCPDAAHQLLDLALDAAQADRRIIFFCSCPSPHGAAWCHRTEVARLVVRAARNRDVRVTVQEWPGGAARRKRVSIRIRAVDMLKVLRGAAGVPLTPKQAKGAIEGMPHGSVVELVAPTGSQIVSVSPPIYRAGKWTLPLFVRPAKDGAKASRLRKEAARERGDCCLEPKSS